MTDETYTAEQVAARLGGGVTANWVKRNAGKLPHHRYGRRVVWTEDDITEIVAGAAHRPKTHEANDLHPIPRGSRRRQVG